ncbi:MAG: sigma-54-dependent Fis family transcriptional regulator [Deltaproteobacteria bacterium]|nr:sigma-54-dependent Fis family transcriptional regulator [Deltaproteobacteria bacterium]
MSTLGRRWLVVEGPSTSLRLALPAFATWTLGSDEAADVWIPEAEIAQQQAVLAIDFGVAVEAVADGLMHAGRPLRVGELVDLRSPDGDLEGPWVTIGRARLGVVAGRSSPPEASRGTEATRPVAESAAMRAALEQAEQAASVDASVLISGEPGSGKDVLAAFIHESSPRGRAPLLRVGCMELETEGPEKVLERGRGTTVLLDEPFDLSERAQLLLAQAIDAGRGTGVRLIATTSVATEAPVRRKLLDRLGELRIRVPPLRQRGEDIVPLAERISSTLGDRLSLAAETKDALERYAWPGNVRELVNVLRSAALLTRDSIRPEHLGFDALLQTPPERGPVEAPELTGSLRAEMEALERRRIGEALEKYPTQAEAAKSLGVPMRTFANRLDALGIPRARKSKREG